MAFAPFRTQQGELFCEDVALRRLATAVATPTYVYSRNGLIDRARRLRGALPAQALACFAVKANGNPAVLRELAAHGFGADVTGGGELFLALHAGIAPQRIIYSGVGKTTAELTAALDADIKAIHVESVQELETLARLAGERRQMVRIGVRVNPNIAANTHPAISTGLHTHKFGVPQATAVALLRRAAVDPWLRPVGLACHIGSQISDLAPFRAAAKFVAQMAVDLRADGIPLEHVDVGGGLGIDYTGEDVPTIEAWANAASQPISEAGFEVVVEPGRVIVGPVGALLTRVVVTKSQGSTQFAVVDAGMSDLLRPTLYGAQHPILPVRQAPATMTYDVVGPICETGDWLGQARPLPLLRPGDLLAVTHAGAYGYAMSSNYNGRGRPAEVLVDGQTWRVIRARQAYADLLAGTED